MREASNCCKEWEASSRRAPLLDLALMHYEFGEATAARNLLRESLAAALEFGDANPGAFLYVLLRKNWSEAVVSVMDVKEIEQWIEKLSRNSAAIPLAANLVSALAANGMEDQADRIYQGLASPDCRLFAAWSVLYGRASKSVGGR